jgi:hypothetical protein
MYRVKNIILSQVIQKTALTARITRNRNIVTAKWRSLEIKKRPP